jgi:hypothetical protein
MKKLLITLLLTLSISVVSANSFVDEVKDLAGVNTEVNINLGTGIIKALLAFSGDEDAKEVNKIMDGLDNIRVSVFELDNSVNTKQLNSIIQSKISSLLSQGFESIVTVKEKHETVNIMAKVNNNKIEDAMIIVMDEEDELVIIDMKGLIDLVQIAEITEHFDIDLKDVAFN